MKITEPADPIARFADVYERARQAESHDHTAFTLATCTSDGRPSARIVLLKSFDVRGFVFFTNRRGRKGRELTKNPWAAMCFFWPSIGEQVRIEGQVELVSEEDSDTYFASRPRGSQIGAWGSDQSESIDSREELLKRCAEIEARFANGIVPRPAHWGGFRVVPERIEFWINQPCRLHDRFLYKSTSDGQWEITMLCP